MTPIEHGTYGGYQKELKAAMQPCDDCRAANVQYMRAFRMAKALNRPVANPAYPPSRTRPGAMKRLEAEGGSAMTAKANASPNHVSKRCPDCGYMRTAPGHKVTCGGES